MHILIILLTNLIYACRMIDYIYLQYNAKKDQFGPREQDYLLEIKEKMEMMNMMDEDRKNSFCYDHMNEYYRSIIFFNELSDDPFQFLLTRILNKTQPFFNQGFYHKEQISIDRFKTDRKTYNHISYLKEIMSIFKRMNDQMDACINLIDKHYDNLKWSVLKHDFPNIDILQFNKKIYIGPSFDKQKEFLKKLQTDFYCHKIDTLIIWGMDSIYFHDDLYKYIHEHSCYDMYFILTLQCSNINHDMELCHYYQINYTRLLQSINNEEEWDVIVEDDDIKIMNHYYLPHPDHFVELKQNMKHDIIFKLSFPFRYMKRNAHYHKKIKDIYRPISTNNINVPPKMTTDQYKYLMDEKYDIFY